MPLNCFLGMRHKKVVLLKQILNEVLKLNPPLVINDRYDAETKAAVMQFEFKSHIRPANGKMDDITWVSLGQVLPPGRLQQLLTAANNDPDLFELFGLVPNSGIIQFNNYPPFNEEDLERVQKSLELAKKRVNDKIQSDTALQSYGIPSVTDSNLFLWRRDKFWRSSVNSWTSGRINFRIVRCFVVFASACSIFLAAPN